MAAIEFEAGVNAVVQVVMFQGVFVGAVDAGNVDNLLCESWSMDEKSQVIIIHGANLNLPDPTGRATTNLPKICTEVRFMGSGHKQYCFSAGRVEGMA